MLKSSLCDYSDAYILVKGSVTVNNTAVGDADANKTNKKVILKNCSIFSSCISEINNTQVDNANVIDILMPMYNLIEYSDNFWRTLEMPLINTEINLILTWSTNCGVVSTNVADQNVTFAITDTKLYVHVLTLSTQDNSKLLQQLKSGFKRVINWNKYLLKPEL